MRRDLSPTRSSFSEQHRDGAHIFELDVPDDAPIHTADFDIFTTLSPGASIVDDCIESALGYWTGTPSSKLREVLVGGAATVRAR